jgi:hypothetical protein
VSITIRVLCKHSFQYGGPLRSVPGVPRLVYDGLLINKFQRAASQISPDLIVPASMLTRFTYWDLFFLIHHPRDCAVAFETGKSSRIKSRASPKLENASCAFPNQTRKASSFCSLSFLLIRLDRRKK